MRRWSRFLASSCSCSHCSRSFSPGNETPIILCTPAVSGLDDRVTGETCSTRLLRNDLNGEAEEFRTLKVSQWLTCNILKERRKLVWGRSGPEHTPTHIPHLHTGTGFFFFFLQNTHTNTFKIRETSHNSQYWHLVAWSQHSTHYLIFLSGVIDYGVPGCVRMTVKLTQNFSAAQVNAVLGFYLTLTNTQNIPDLLPRRTSKGPHDEDVMGERGGASSSVSYANIMTLVAFIMN